VRLGGVIRHGIILVGPAGCVINLNSFIWEWPSGKRAFAVHVLPIHRTEIAISARDATALVLIVDPEHEPEPEPAFGLTNTKAEIALRIGRGAELKQISEELSVSMTTVRTHLQHFFTRPIRTVGPNSYGVC